MVEKKGKRTYINYMKPKGRVVSDFGADLLDEARAKQKVAKDVVKKKIEDYTTEELDAISKKAEDLLKTSNSLDKRAERIFDMVEKVTGKKIQKNTKDDDEDDDDDDENIQEKAIKNKDRGKYYGDENFPVYGGQNVEDPEQFNEPPVFGAKYNRELRESSELWRKDFANPQIEDMWGEMDEQKGNVKEWITDMEEPFELKPKEYLYDFEIEALKKRQKIISDMNEGNFEIPEDDPIADFFDKVQKDSDKIWDFVKKR